MIAARPAAKRARLSALTFTMRCNYNSACEVLLKRVETGNYTRLSRLTSGRREHYCISPTDCQAKHDPPLRRRGCVEAVAITSWLAGRFGRACSDPITSVSRCSAALRG